MMNSATSIDKRSFQLKADAAQAARAKAPVEGQAEDAGFRPMHFFVLASLMTATAAVVMSRQSTPEHLILISLIIAAAGAAAAGFYRMLAPLASDDAAAFLEPMSERSRATLEREKALVLRSIKELEFDRAMGKLSSKDFDEMAGRLRARAITLIKQVDEGATGYRELIERELAARLGPRAKGLSAAVAASTPPVETTAAAPPLQAATVETVEAEIVEPETVRPAPVAPQSVGRCSSCSTTNDPDAVFCKRCGTRLAQHVHAGEPR